MSALARTGNAENALSLNGEDDQASLILRTDVPISVYAESIIQYVRGHTSTSLCVDADHHKGKMYVHFQFKKYASAG